MKPWREIVPPGPIYADELNELARAVASLLKISGEGVDVDQTPTGVRLRVPPAAVRFRARVWVDSVGSGSGGSGSGLGFCPTRTAYAWQQQRPTTCGEWEDDPFGLSGSIDDGNPAFEANATGSQAVAENAVVELTPAAVYIDQSRVIQEWVFDASTSASGADAGGFWAILMSDPDGNSAVGLPSVTWACGSGGGDPDDPCAIPAVFPRGRQPGYGWVAAVGDCCENIWRSVPNATSDPRFYGTNCKNQAYEANNLPTPLTINGNPMVVWMRKRPTAAYLGGPCPDDLFNPHFTYVFDRPVGAAPAGGSGCGVGGTSAAELFQNCQVLDGCWGVEIGGQFFPIIVKDSNGNVIAGGG
jgi:hypothetical protein